LTTVYPRGESEPEGHKTHGKFIRDFAVTLSNNGNEIHVLTPRSLNTKTFENLDGIYVHRFPYFLSRKLETLTYGDGIPENLKKIRNWFLIPFLLTAFLINAMHLLRRHNIGIINAHWIIPTGFLGLFIKTIVPGSTLVITSYGVELFLVINGKYEFLKPFLKTAILKADHIAAISHGTANAVSFISGRKNVAVIPFGINTKYYTPGAKNEKLCQRYNLKGKTIFFSGRMVERKGHRFLLEAMTVIRQKFFDATLILGGRGPLFYDLINLKHQLSLDENVIMPGYIDEKEMVEHLRLADVFVLPSYVDAHGDTEGSALAALEAMACGTPAIITDIGGNKNTIEEGAGAYYCEPGNSHSIAEKVIKLLIDDSLLNEQSKKARDFIMKNYSWKTIIRKFECLIDKD